MNRTLLSAVALSALVLASGCAKKAPKTAPAPPPAAETPRPAPAPAPSGDPVASGLPSDLVELNAELARRGLLGDVYFDYDQASLDASARERLAKNGEFLSAHPEYQVTLEGHCDERGTNEYNLALGERRASAAHEYLSTLGAARSRLRTVSYGEERAQCSVSAESCWRTNRRVHFVVTGRTGA